MSRSARYYVTVVGCREGGAWEQTKKDALNLVHYAKGAGNRTSCEKGR